MGSKIWRFGAVVVIVAAIVVGVTLRLKAVGDAKPTYKLAKVTRGTVTSTVSATGTLQPYDTTISVKSNVGGTVVKLAVDIGDHVKKGQLIALIDPTDSQLTLQENQADLSAAKAKLGQSYVQWHMQLQLDDEAVRSAEQAVANARVKLTEAQETAKLQPLLTTSDIQQSRQNLAAAKAKLVQADESNRIQPELTTEAIKDADSNLTAARSAYEQARTATDPQRIAAAQAAYDQTKAAYEYAQTDLKRQQNLFAKGFVPRSTVDTSQQQYAAAKAQLDNANATLNTVHDAVDQDLHNLQARIDQAAAQLRTAQANRSQDLLKQQDLKAAQAGVAQAQATLDASEANRAQDTIKQQEVAVAQAALKQAMSQLNTARAGLLQDQIQMGNIKQNKAAVVHTEGTVKDATTTLNYCTITAPRDGVVVNKYVEVGSIVPGARSLTGVGEGVSLVDLDDTTRILAYVSVDETDIGQLAVGQNVDVTLDAYPDELFDGKVIKIVPIAAVVQNVTTVQVNVEIDMPDSRTKPGLNCECVFITNRRPGVLMVPNEAVHDADAGSTVQVLDHGQPKDVAVTIGLQGDNYSEVMKGLNEGDDVVTAIIDPHKPKTTAAPAGGGGMGGGRGPGMPRGM